MGCLTATTTRGCDPGPERGAGESLHVGQWFGEGAARAEH